MSKKNVLTMSYAKQVEYLRIRAGLPPARKMKHIKMKPDTKR